MVRRGRLRIFIRDEQGSEITFRYYGPGQIVGEFSILDDRERSASADAPEGAQVMALSRDAFLQFLNDRPMIGITMMRSLAERVRYTTQYLERMLNAVELLTHSDYEQALAAMTAGENDEDSIQGMINAFVQMTRSMREREGTLPRVGARSKVEVDRTEGDT
jgi:CRP-like cAMP-binding protein